MKSIRILTIAFAVLGCMIAPLAAAELQGQPERTPVIRVINFKSIVELSKAGKQEQANFDGLKKQMETVLSEKEKVLSDMASKLEDPDYRDSLTPEAETDLNRKFRALGNEFTQIQTQYYQTLQQANYKILQKLQESVVKAANRIAKQNGIDIILNEESCFFAASSFDISSQVVSMMDKIFDEEESSKPQDLAPKGQLPIPQKSSR